MKKILGLALGLLLGLAPGAWAQFATGNVYGSVTDESGAVLPGASVTVTGATIGGRSTTTGSNGDFRFLNLDPGTYKLTVALTGFTTVNREIIVTTGQSVNLTFGLKVATVEETVTVTAETPIVDTKKIGTTTTLSKEELSQIPNSRDPWAVLRTIPGVVVDRVNIAGNESGQQSSFQGKGSDVKDSMWNLDGVVITDMAAIGASPTYFDYDAFDEISVSTGGNDLKVQTGGIGLNFVTKRGTNAFHGSVRGFFTHDDFQSSNIKGTPLESDPRLRTSSGPDGKTGTSDDVFSDKADHIAQVADYGADVGGPIIKDKLWFWGSYGKQDIRNVRTNQTADKTILTDYNAKLNWQASDSDMVSLFYFLGGKEKFGRGVGTGLNESDDFLWNQGGAYPESRPHGLLKIEDNHVFSPNFFVNAKYAYYGTGFTLTPKGGADKDGAQDFNAGTAYGSYITYTAIRPQHTANVDANYFLSGMGGNHELKFGFGYRQASVNSTTSFSGANQIYSLKYTATSGYALVTRDRVANYKTELFTGYVGDTFTKDRLTVNVGVRFDRQTGGNEPSSATANPAFPQNAEGGLPALDFPGTGQGVTWNDFSPRVGITLALDEARKTVVRASYARYAGQLSASDASYDNPIGSPSYLAYNWVDTNNDGFAQPNELLIDQGIAYFGFVDPANPANVTSPNKIDPNYKSNIDHEAILGIDHELMPNFGVSAAYTFRRSNNITGWQPRIGLTSNDYTANAGVTRNGYAANSFSPNAALVDATGGGRILTNRPGYSRQFSGFELSLFKRLSNKWMARVAGSYMSWTESFDGGDALGSGAVQNPTRTDSATQGTVTGFAGPSVDGGQFAPRSGGSGKGDIFYAPKWQINGNALYQLPWGFELSGNVFARQGYPRPIVVQLSSGRDGTIRVIGQGSDTQGKTAGSSTGKVDDVRYDALVDLDLRLSYNLKLPGDTGIVFTADCFNVLNNSTALNQNRTASSSAFNRTDELLSPRIFRFGLRFTF